ncbi:hypothetical protein [Halomarina litorea]|uniref:hypothetical protein n=1 Tax=Halomarina litorea TaxID=2961595 RepID=UPI0020C27B15|nr:hypothetical protein [Halomarina sp. BCD28]
MQSLPVELVQSVVDLVVNFGEIAGGSVMQSAMLLSGAIFLVVASVVFGYLVFGALVRPAGNLPTPGKGHRERREQEFRGR